MPVKKLWIWLHTASFAIDISTQYRLHPHLHTTSSTEYISIPSLSPIHNTRQPGITRKHSTLSHSLINSRYQHTISEPTSHSPIPWTEYSNTLSYSPIHRVHQHSQNGPSESKHFGHKNRGNTPPPHKYGTIKSTMQLAPTKSLKGPLACCGPSRSQIIASNVL